MEKKLFSLYKNQITIHASNTTTPGFFKITPDGFQINGVIKDIYDDTRAAHLDSNGYLHARGTYVEDTTEPDDPVTSLGDFEAGSIDSSTGATKTSAITVRTSQYSSCSSKYQYTVTSSSNMKYFRFYYYDSAKNYISCTDEATTSKTVSAVPPSNAAYMKFKFGSEDEVQSTALTQAQSLKVTSSTASSGDGGSEEPSVPTPPVSGGDLLYKIGVLADCHIDGDGNDEAKSLSDITKAIEYFNSQSVAAICIAGDVGRGGRAEDFKKVKSHFAAAKMPIYCVKGNHDNEKNSSSTASGYKDATGCENDYVKTINGDVFIFLSMANSDTKTGGLTDAKNTWLKQQLSTYKSKRKFLFYHQFVPGTCGNPNNIYWGGMDSSKSVCSTFANAIKPESKLIFVSGHSHLLLNVQDKYSNSNYYHKDGQCYYLHCPGSGRCRNASAGDDHSKAEGYLVEVYADKVIFRGLDIVNKKLLTKYVYTINLPQS